MTDAALQRGWLAVVPVMFQTAAASIEKHRARLLGDPAALRATSRTWSREAAALDDAWMTFNTAGRVLMTTWTGDAADACSRRMDAIIGQTSAVASDLAYSSEGLLLVADMLADVRRCADTAVRAFIEEVRRLYFFAEAYRGPPASSARVVSEIAVRGSAAAARTLQHVFMQEQRLDALLASIPGRFVAGPEAAWRHGIQSVTRRSVDSSFGGALTVDGIRLTRREGMIASRLPDGRIQLTFTDGYGLGLHGSSGAKISVDALPESMKAALVRVYGEAEVAAVGGYTLRYRFATAAGAQQFLDRLDGTDAVSRLGSTARDTLGFFAGPLAELNPWHEALIGRDPDEVTLSVGAVAKASGDVGFQPAAAGLGQVGADGNMTVTLRADGSYAVSGQLSGNAKGGATALGWTQNLGLSGNMLARVDYDPDNQPIRLIVQGNRVDHYDYIAGTNSTYVGARSLPVQLQNKGTHVKADVERMVRHVTSYSLDLTDPGSAVAFNQAVRTPGLLPHSGLVARLGTHGVITTQEYSVVRQSGETSATVGRGPAFGMKFGTASEDQELRHAEYSNPRLPGSIDLQGRRSFRPIPQDPVPGTGIVDVEPDQVLEHG